MTVLLQVLDDGRLTDSKGRVVDFSNTIVLATTNLGAQYLLKDFEAQGMISINSFFLSIFFYLQCDKLVSSTRNFYQRRLSVSDYALQLVAMMHSEELLLLSRSQTLT